MSYLNKNIEYITHTGRHITLQEEFFISSYVETKNASLSVQQAGYRCKAPSALN